MRNWAWGLWAIPFAAFIVLVAASLVSLGILTAGTDGDSSTTESDSGLELINNQATMLRGCADNEILKWDETEDDWNCEADGGGGGGSAVILDLGDDSSNESTDLTEIATTGDTNSIFTEPSADKLLIAVGNNWPTADTADALSANPADCAANNFATTIAANGDLTCAQPNFTDLAGTATDAQIPDTITIDLAGTATALAANPTDCAADTKADAIAASGNLTCTSVDTGDITDGTILEADLAAVDAAVDEECLTYEATVGDFEWQSCGGGASAFNDLSDVTVAKKTADETVNNSSTFQNDDELLCAVGANELWIFEHYLIFTSGSTPDIKWQYSVPASTTITGNAQDLVSNDFNDLVDWTTSQFNVGATNILVWGNGLINTAGTSGNVQLQWAQNTADPSNTTVHEGSLLICYQVE